MGFRPSNVPVQPLALLHDGSEYAVGTIGLVFKVLRPLRCGFVVNSFECIAIEADPERLIFDHRRDKHVPELPPHLPHLALEPVWLVDPAFVQTCAFYGAERNLTAGMDIRHHHKVVYFLLGH